MIDQPRVLYCPCKLDYGVGREEDEDLVLEGSHGVVDDSKR